MVSIFLFGLLSLYILKKHAILSLDKAYFHAGGGVTKNKISGVCIMLESQMRHQINCETCRGCRQFSSKEDPWILPSGFCKLNFKNVSI